MVEMRNCAFISTENLSHNPNFSYVCKCQIKTKYNYLCLNLILLIILYSIKNVKNSELIKNYNIISNTNQITLKVKGTGNATIFYPAFSPEPSKIKINNNDISVSSSISLPSYSSEHTVILIWNSSLSNCNNMFQGCSQIKEIDLSEFNSSSVYWMDFMFDSCTSLTSINFKNFNTSKVTYMCNVFQNCESLISLDLSSFDTNLVNDFHYMFYNCKSLIYLNISSFIISSGSCFHNMFNGCISLTSLDLSSFYTSLNINIGNLFYGCEKLEYVNLQKSLLTISKIQNYNNAATGVAKNIVFCVKEESIDVYRNYILSDVTCPVIISDCNSDWRKSQKKIVPNLSSCVDNCTSSNYKFEYLGKCYSQCPNGTVNIDYICYDCSNPDCKECDPNNKTLCKSCLDSSKYLQNGRCISSCSNGYYISSEDSSIKICECDLTQCEICSLVSKSKNLCISCNIGYYPIFNEQNNGDQFLDCYQDIEGYYLDKTNTQFYFKKCYDTCQTCNNTGNVQYHNCLTCKSDYKFEIEFNNFKNCYPKCNNYYYFDNSNILFCTETLNCPNEYNKLISAKKECVTECSEDIKYNYEFQNQCYEKCPQGTEENKTRLYYCDVKCSKEFPFEIISTQNCTNFCGINDWNNGLCKSNYEDNDTNTELILSNILYDLINNKYEVIPIDPDKEIIIKEKWATLTLINSKTKNNYLEIDGILECENILKNNYNIPFDKPLIILIINISKEDMIQPKFEYEVYYPLNGINLERLDLNLCLNDQFKITNCSTYSLESILKDSCLSCKEGFFPIYNNDPLDIAPFIKCYKDPKGYYFDEIVSEYKLCFNSCQTCDKGGDENFHNCITCNKYHQNELLYEKYKNCYDECPYYFYYNSNEDKNYCTEDLNCTNYEYNKLILDKRKCVNNCTSDDEYKYEFKNNCYKNCPKNSKESENIPFYCEAKCPKEFPFLVLSTQDCVTSCSIKAIMKQNCIVNYNNIINISISEVEQKMLDNIQLELTNGFDVSDIDNGTDVYMAGIISLFTITNTFNQKNQKNSSKTTIDFSNCENNLKSFYNISEDSSLYILKIDTNQTGMKIPNIEYEVYYPINDNDKNLVKLNLSICQNDKIDLYYTVEITDDNLDKYYTNSDYYKDICYTTTSEKGTDVSLEDRKNEYIVKNLSICGEGCLLTIYDKKTNKSKCKCDIKKQISSMSEIKINKTKLLESFSDLKNNINIKIIKCYKLLLSLEGLKNNIGFYIFISMIFLSLIFLLLFLVFDYKILKNKIDLLVNTKQNWKMLKVKFNKNKKNTTGNKTNNRNNIKETNNINKSIKRKKRKKKIGNNNRNILQKKNLINLVNKDNKKIKIINSNINNNIINNKIFINNQKENPLILSVIKKNKKNKNYSRTKLIKKNINSINIMGSSKNKSQNKNINSNQIQPNSLKTIITTDKPFEYYEKIMKPNDIELNNMTYLKARKLDKRTYCEYYISLLKTRHILIFSFCSKNDYNSQVIKIYLFFFIAIINFSINSLFFTDSTMHEIYEDEGNFDFVYQIPQIVACSLISGILTSFFKLLSLSEKDILFLKQEKNLENINGKKNNILQKINIKFITFFVLSFLLQILFAYYVSCFYEVYHNTQMHLLKDFLISLGISLLYPLGIYLIPGIIRNFSLHSKNKNKKCLYDFSKLFQML